GARRQNTTGGVTLPFAIRVNELYSGSSGVASKLSGGHTQHYDSRLVTSVIYFSYSGREIRLPSRSTRARSFAGREAWISSTRFHGARGVSHVERGTNSDG